MKALTVVNLPGVGRKNPGDKITKKELAGAGQNDDNIKQLVDDGAIGDDDDELHLDHQPIEVEGAPGPMNVYASDESVAREEVN